MKNLVIGVIAVVILGFVGLFFLQNNSSDPDLKKAQEIYQKDDINPETVKEINEPFYQNQLTKDELSDVVSNKEDALVYFYSPTCYYCKEFAPTLEKAIGEVTVDLSLHNLLEFPKNWDTYKVEGTPTLIRFKAGVEVDRLVGEQDLATTKEWLEKNK